MCARQQPDDLGLQAVGVLILVHHDVTKCVREPFGHLGMRLQQLAQLGQQVIVVQQAALVLVVAVVLFDPREFVQLGEQMRKLVVQHLGDATDLVRSQAQDLDDSLLTGEAALFLVQSQTSADQVDDIF